MCISRGHKIAYEQRGQTHNVDMKTLVSITRKFGGRVALDFGKAVLDNCRQDHTVYRSQYHWVGPAADEGSRTQSDSRLRRATCLFLLRPHPDDSSIYQNYELLKRANLVLVDDIFLTSIDWPISRMVRAVDGVITTHSTLLLDAMAAETPVVRIPVNNNVLKDQKFVDTSLPIESIEDLAVIGDEDWHKGRIPDKLFAKDQVRQNRSWFSPSLNFFLNLRSVLNQSDSKQDAEKAKRFSETNFYNIAQLLNFSDNPHHNIAAVDSALKLYLNEPWDV